MCEGLHWRNSWKNIGTSVNFLVPGVHEKAIHTLIGKNSSTEVFQVIEGI